MNRLVGWFSDRLSRHPIRFGIIAVLVTVAASVFVADRFAIDADLTSMLGDESSSVAGLTEASDRYGSLSPRWLVLRGSEPESLRIAADRLAARVVDLPQVAAALRGEPEYFEDRALLWLPVETLEKLDETVAERAKSIQARQNPLFAALDDESEEFASTFEELREETRSAAPPLVELVRELPADASRGVLMTPDGRGVVIPLRIRSESSDLSAAKELDDAVRAEFESLRIDDVELTIMGGFRARAHEASIIERDIALSAALTFLLVGLLLWAWTRRWTAVAILMVPLSSGIVLALVYAFLVTDALGMVTSFVIALLLGLGIDAGIHLYVRFQAEFESHDGELVEVLERILRRTGGATIIAALTTASVFGVLASSSFAALSELGWVAAGATVVVAVVMIFGVPLGAVLLLSVDRDPLAGSMREITIYPRGRRLQLGVVLAASAAAIFGIYAVAQIEFDDNFRQFQLDPPSKTSALDIVRKTLNLPDVPALTVVISDDALASAVLAETLLEDAVRDEPRWPTIAGAVSVHQAIPAGEAEQQARLELIRSVRTRLGGSDFERWLEESELDEAERAEIDRFRELAEVNQPVDAGSLPAWVTRVFSEAGPEAHAGQFDTTVLIVPTVDDLDGSELAEFEVDLKEAMAAARARLNDPDDVGFLVASPAFLLTDIQERLRHQTRSLIPLALLVVAFIVWVLIRRPFDTLLALVPLGLGLSWTAGAMFVLGLEIDMFNLSALLMIIGLGVDDGVHLAHRWMETSRGLEDVESVWTSTGGAVLLTSLTTMIGFGSLMFTHHAGLRSIGYVSTVGIIATTLAALVVMPSLLALTRGRNV